MKKIILAAAVLLAPSVAHAQFATIRCWNGTTAFPCGDLVSSSLRVKVIEAPTLTISGTVTANQGGSWAVTANAGTNLNTSALATSAQLTTLIGHADGLEGLLAGTLTVGTHAVTQSGTWTVTGAGGTFPVTATNLDVQIGGSDTVTVAGTVTANAGTNLNTSALLTTSAHDAAFGTAGAADAQVRSIQGIASMTPVQVSQATASNLNATVTDGTGPLTVDGTVTANAGSGTFTVDSELPAAAALADNTANPTPPAVGSFLLGWDGTNWDRLQTGSATGGALKVDGSAVTQPVSGTLSVNTHAVTQSGTWTVQPGNTANTTPWLFSINQGGNTAAVNASSQLSVNCANCSGSGVSQQDNTGFAPGTTNFVPVGGEVDDTGTAAVAENSAGAARLTTQRALHVNLRDATGAELSVGGGTQYDQGTAAGAADKLTQAGAVRRDTAALDAGVADGDRAALSTDSVGRLRVTSADTTQPVSGTVTANAGTGSFTVAQATAANLNATVTDGSGALTVDGTVAVTGVATSANQSTEITALQKIDNLAHAGGDVALVEHVPVSGQLDDAATGTVTENNVAPVRITSGRALHVAQQGTVTVSGTVTANAGSGTFTVSDGSGAMNVIVDSAPTTTVTATNLDVQIGGSDSLTIGTLPALVAGTANIGDVDVASIAAGNNNIGDVDVASLPSVTIGTFPDNEPINVAQVGGQAVVLHPCSREARIHVSINQTAGTQLATGTASERIFICSIHVVTATAQNVALVSGTGSVCATSTSGVEGFGGATAATGWNFAANGGIVLGASDWGYGKTDTDADNLCLLQSGAGQVSGGLTYVSASNF